MKQKTKMEDFEVCLFVSGKGRLIGAIGSSVLVRKELTKGATLRVANAMVLPTLHDLWL